MFKARGEERVLEEFVSPGMRPPSRSTMYRTSLTMFAVFVSRYDSSIAEVGQGAYPRKCNSDKIHPISRSIPWLHLEITAKPGGQNPGT